MLEPLCLAELDRLLQAGEPIPETAEQGSLFNDADVSGFSVKIQRTDKSEDKGNYLRQRTSGSRPTLGPDEGRVVLAWESSTE